MKNYVKNCLSILLSLLLVVLSVPHVASAAGGEDPLNNFITDSSTANTTSVIDEITFVKQLKSYTEKELYDMGCTKDEVEYIENYDYNKDLVDLSKKSENELKERGYTNGQIKKIKAYDGVTDALNYVEAYSLSNATLSLTYSVYGYSTSTFCISWRSVWSSAPIFKGQDIVAFTWMACNSNSSIISMSHSEQQVGYASYYGTSSEAYQTTYDITPSFGIGTYSMQFSVGIDNDHFYAKQCGGNILLKTQSGSSNLYSIQILSSYGHSTVTLSPSVGFDTSGLAIGISFGLTMQDLSRSLHTYNYKGTQLN